MSAMSPPEEDLVALIQWCRARFDEHMSSVIDLETAGREGRAFDVGNGLAQLRHMLNLNVQHISKVLGDNR